MNLIRILLPEGSCYDKCFFWIIHNYYEKNKKWNKNFQINLIFVQQYSFGFGNFKSSIC